MTDNWTKNSGDKL